MSTPPAAAAEATGQPLHAGHPRRWLILAIILAVECMDLLDATVTNVAGPSIKASLGASETGLQWIIGGYSFAFSVGLVTSGRLGDIYGRRRVFFTGMLGFTVASLACGAAPTTGWLIALRLVQGLFGALMIPQGFGIMRDVFAEEELPKAFGVFGPVIGLSAVLGPILGGVLVDANLFGSGWRLVFLINVPVGLVAYAIGRPVVPESKAPEQHRLDVPGALLVGLASFLVVYPLIQGRTADWAAWTWLMLIGGIASFVVFGFYERARARSGADPLVTPSLFAKQPFVAGLLSIVVFFGGMSGVMLTMSLYLQIGQGFGPAHTGLTFGPWSLGMAMGAALSGAKLAEKYGRKVLQVGIVVSGVATLGLLAVVDQAGRGISGWQLAGPLLVMGFGIGLIVAPLFSFILTGVEDHEVGTASGVLNAVQQFAGALGVAAVGTAFFSAAAKHGPVEAFRVSLWIEVATMVVSLAISPLLPRFARSELEH